MDLFGFKRRKAQKRFEESLHIFHKHFMENLPTDSDESLLRAWSTLGEEALSGAKDKFTSVKLSAVEDELTKRGYIMVNDYTIVQE